ncbi:MAG: hypothetical protein AAGA12_07635 [Pseudomonadota bacterium]
MARKVLILGASYGSLFGTKLAMAGHTATLVCRKQTADLINRDGTEVRLKLRDEDAHRSIFSKDYGDRVNASTPEDLDPSNFDLVVLAMQEPQYSHPTLKALLSRLAAARLPCLSIMNMPPLPYMKRFGQLGATDLSAAYSDASVWDAFEPGLMSLCSPDPQAFRPPEEAANILHVGLPTNFKAARFEDPVHTSMLRELERDIEAVRLDGKDVPVKLRTFDSLFVPFAKWSMLMTGNYRCVTDTSVRPIIEAVYDDLEKSRRIYQSIDDMVCALGAAEADLVPFEKYAKAAEGLLKPSSAARAIVAGSQIERVDRLIQVLSRALGAPNADVDMTVSRVDAALERNRMTDAA